MRRRMFCANPARLAGTALAALPAALAMLLSACVFPNDRVAGAEDFPNTIAPVGRVAADDISSYGQWERIQEFPAMPDLNGVDSLRVPQPAVGVGGAGKILASAPQDSTASLDLSDTLHGRASRILYRDYALRTQRDTLVFRWNAAFRDSIAGNDLLLEARGAIAWKAGGQVQAYRFLNTDSSGPVDQAEFSSSVAGAGGLVTLQRLKVFAFGGSLESARGPSEFETLRRRGSDTLEWTRVADADGDSSLWAAGDSGIVELRYQSQDPLLTPLVARRSVVLRASIRNRGGDARQLYYRDDRLLRDGTTERFLARGARGDSLLRASDTAYLAFDQVFPAGDSLIDARAGYVVLLGPRPDGFADHRLLAFRVMKRWRLGPLDSTATAFTPDAPVPPGQIGIQCGFTLASHYADGSSGSASGVFRNDSIQMDLHESRNGSDHAYQVVYDSKGTIRRQEKGPVVAENGGGGESN